MKDVTNGLIYAIKRSGKPWNQAVAKYMSNYSGSPIEEYTETVINLILKQAFVDYIETCDDPEREVSDLLDFIQCDGSHSLGYYLAMVLGNTQVRDGDRFVNGFSECKEDYSEDFCEPEPKAFKPQPGPELTYVTNCCCGKCDASIFREDLFCRVCGSPVDWSNE